MAFGSPERWHAADAAMAAPMNGNCESVRSYRFVPDLVFR